MEAERERGGEGAEREGPVGVGKWVGGEIGVVRTKREGGSGTRWQRVADEAASAS